MGGWCMTGQSNVDVTARAFNRHLERQCLQPRIQPLLGDHNALSCGQILSEVVSVVIYVSVDTDRRPGNEHEDLLPKRQNTLCDNTHTLHASFAKHISC